MNTLIKVLAKLLLKLTLALKEVYPTTAPGSQERQNAVRAWENQVKAVIARYIQTAYFLGYGDTETLPEPQAVADALAPMVQTQFDFLKGFATEIEDSQEEWQRGWENRAESYSGSVTQPYWQGKTRMLPLPALPGQGTQCHGRCRCSWKIKQFDGEGNYNCYWIAKDESDSTCQTCKQRAIEWNPLKIRENRLVIE
jgi:hypothetical protein